MRRFLLLGLFVLLMNAGCTICHTYGPYMGKVVDKETGEPIEGAVAYVHFTSHAPFGITSWNDGWEMLTDSNGEFLFPRQTVWRSRFMERWDLDVRLIVLKPGYALGKPLVKGTYPEGKKLVIELPRLKTVEERKKNLGSFAPTPPLVMKLLYQAYNQERVNLGLEPMPVY
jgi:hypothetical protein